MIGDLVRRVAEDVLRAEVPRGDAAAVVDHEHRVVGDAVEHQAHARLDFAQAPIRDAPLALATLDDELRVIERRRRVPAKLRHQPQVIVGKQRAAALDDEAHAPRLAVGRDRRDQQTCAEVDETILEAELAIGRPAEFRNAGRHDAADDAGAGGAGEVRERGDAGGGGDEVGGRRLRTNQDQDE